MGQLRFGVSARILVGIALLAALTVTTSAIALTALLDFRDNFSHTAEQRIPRMLLAARLRKQSVGVLSDVAGLVLANDRYQRELASSAIAARMKSTWVLTAGLAASGVDAHWIEQLEELRESLGRDVLALDALLEAQMQTRERLRLQLAGLRQLEKEAVSVRHELVPLLDRERLASLSGWGGYAITTSLDEEESAEKAPDSEKAYLREYVRPLQAWLTALHEARMLLAETVAFNSVERIDTQAGRFRQALKQLERGLHTLPQELSERLRPLLEALTSAGLDSATGLLVLRRAEIARRDKLESLLVSSRLQADRLAGTVARLMGEISDQVRRDATRFRRDIDRLAVLALLACVISAVGAAGLAAYVNGSLRKRLRRLQHALRTYPASGGEPPADRRPDEIGDIGRALGYFMKEISRRERRLQQLASTDELTCVSNRRHFFEEAAREFARARRDHGDLAILMVDVDRFKTINDRHGHAVGDEALRALAHACKAAMREMDVFGRLGGEEFAVLLPGMTAAQAEQAAERLRQRLLGIAVPAADQLLRFTVSIGVAVLHPEDAGVDALLLRADSALYDAKRDGRNCVRLRTREGPDGRGSDRNRLAHGHG